MLIQKVLALEVSEEELVKRLLKRGETSGRSDDTNEEIIRKRYQVYKAETEAVAEHYDEQDKLVRLKGEGSVDDIFNSLSRLIIEEMEAQEAQNITE